MSYEALKFLHIIGVVILLGNVTITAFWKVLSDMTRDPVVIAHAQRGVTISDWIFTLSGIVLVLGGGFGAAYVQDIPAFEPGWIRTAELLFLLSGALWLFILVPLQTAQAREARLFAVTGVIPPSYWRRARAWLWWGVAATVPLVAATYVMVAK